MAYTAITAGQVDADSPIDTTLMGTIKDNFIDHDTRILNGEAGGFPLANGAVTPAKLSAQTVGDYLISDNDTARTTTSTSYVLLKETKIGKSGAYRVKFRLRELYGPTASVYGRIYKNGIAVGTERSVAAGGDTTFSEDLSGFASGDLVQVYGKTATITTVEISNFRLYGANPGEAGAHLNY